MSKIEKLLAKFKAPTGQFKWSEMIALLAHLWFQKVEGKGSRVVFINGAVIIKLHKPHPQKKVKAYVVKQVKEILEREGLL